MPEPASVSADEEVLRAPTRTRGADRRHPRTAAAAAKIVEALDLAIILAESDQDA